jgi:hypothetical protein
MNIPTTAKELAANLSNTRSEAAREARAARALNPVENPEARAYALSLVRSTQNSYPKLSAANAARRAVELDRLCHRYATEARSWSSVRPKTAALYSDYSNRYAALANDLRRYAWSVECAKRADELIAFIERR